MVRGRWASAEMIYAFVKGVVWGRAVHSCERVRNTPAHPWPFWLKLLLWSGVGGNRTVHPGAQRWQKTALSLALFAPSAGAGQPWIWRAMVHCA